MSKVESRRVISNRRRTVGLVQTSTSEPWRRVRRRSPLSRTLSPVESMNSTREKSSTSAVLPSAMAAFSRSEKRGAVLTWISPAASRMRVVSSTSSSVTSNLGWGKSFIQGHLLSPGGSRQSRFGAARRSRWARTSCSETSSASSAGPAAAWTGVRTSSKLAAPQPAQRVAAALSAPHAVHRKGSCTIHRVPVWRETEPPVRPAWRSKALVAPRGFALALLVLLALLLGLLLRLGLGLGALRRRRDELGQPGFAGLDVEHRLVGAVGVEV